MRSQFPSPKAGVKPRPARALIACAARAGALGACGGTEEPADTPITISLTRAPDQPRPGARVEPGGARVALARLHAAAHLPPRGRRAGRRAGSRARLRPARDLRRRAHLRARAARGPDLLGRQPRSGPRTSSTRSSACGALRLARRPLLPRDRPGSRPTTRAGGSRSSSPRPTASSPTRWRSPTRRRCRRGRRFSDLSADPPPGVGPYEITAVEPDGGFVLERSADLRRPRHPRRPDRQPGRDQGDRRPEPRAPGPGRARRQGRLHAGPAAAGAQADDRRAGERPLCGHARPRRPRTSPSTSGSPPFDDPLVREAVNRGICPAALARAHGGTAARAARCSRPGSPATTATSTPTDCPYGDPARAAGPRRRAGADRAGRRARRPGDRRRRRRPGRPRRDQGVRRPTWTRSGCGRASRSACRARRPACGRGTPTFRGRRASSARSASTIRSSRAS